MRDWDQEIAWAAGFFEGEGSTTLHDGRLALQVKNNDLEPLEHFRRAVEAGEIYGPYAYHDRLGKNPFWIWVAHGGGALGVMRVLAPWLTERRLGQMLDTLAKVRGRYASAADDAYSWIRDVRRQRQSS